MGYCMGGRDKQLTNIKYWQTNGRGYWEIGNTTEKKTSIFQKKLKHKNISKDQPQIVFPYNMLPPR